VITRGWADLDRGVPLAVRHRFPVTGITALVTATVVLRLVADGRIGLDDAADDHLRTVRLADGTITVRELLSHAAGVDNPAPAGLMADSVPDLTAVTGPVIGCSDAARGIVRPSNGGYAALGQLITDVTGLPYAEAATRLVLEPLGMTGSSFPRHSAELGPDAVTGYDVTPDGMLVPAPAMICTIPAVAGLWAPAGDIVRLGTGWSALLPAELARGARPAGRAGARRNPGRPGLDHQPSRRHRRARGRGPRRNRRAARPHPRSPGSRHPDEQDDHARPAAREGAAVVGEPWFPAEPSPAGRRNDVSRSCQQRPGRPSCTRH